MKQEQPHHRNPDDFLDAARNGCYICRAITTSPSWNSMKAQEPFQQAVWYLSPLRGSPSGWLRLGIDCLADDLERLSESRSESTSGSGLDGGVDLSELESPAWGFNLQPVDGKDIRYVINLEILFVY